MVVFESSSGAETILTSCFQLRFRWHEDRWEHEVASAGAAGSLPRFRSVEMATDLDGHRRVVSPAYQQIHLEQDRQRGVVRAFLVGQSGPHHFSAAFEVAERPHGAVIDVDVADRCRQPVEYLAATYLVEPTPGAYTGEARAPSDPDAEAGPAAAARDAIVLTCERPHGRLIFEADPPGRPMAEEAGHGAVRLQALAHVIESNQTHRFRYRWRWVTDPRPSIWDHTA